MLIFVLLLVSFFFYIQIIQFNDSVMQTNNKNYVDRRGFPSRAEINELQDLNFTNTSSDLLDFAIIGFPKCGTTFLRKTLLDPKDDSKIFWGNNDTEIHLLRQNKLEAFLKLYEEDRSVKFQETLNAFKCPDLLYSPLALNHLHKHFPTTNVIVSVRHPITWFESFYNYRIRKGYKMSPPESLVGKCPKYQDDGTIKAEEDVLYWGDKLSIGTGHGLCTDKARFHLALSRLGLTKVTSKNEKKLLLIPPTQDNQHKWASGPFGNRKLFLFEIGQLSIKNRNEADQFVTDLESFLETEHDGKSPHGGYQGGQRFSSLPRLKEHIKKHNIGKDAKVEEVTRNEIDICHRRYDTLRQELMTISKQASNWITNYLIKSPNVVVSNKETFLKLIKSWEQDPCTQLRLSKGLPLPLP